MRQCSLEQILQRLRNDCLTYNSFRIQEAIYIDNPIRSWYDADVDTFPKLAQDR